LNSTGFEQDAIYILAASNYSIDDYMLCSLFSNLEYSCSTQYEASIGGGSMASNCKANNNLRYSESYPDAPDAGRQKNWVDVAADWALAISLSAGINDDDSSNARLLTQLIPTTPNLNATLPSIAEALAVLAGCTLLSSGIDSPFVDFFNYTTQNGILDPPVYQIFNATLRYNDYASGGTARWQGIFYLVLMFVFVFNVFCLVYFVRYSGIVVDLTDPEFLYNISDDVTHPGMSTSTSYDHIPLEDQDPTEGRSRSRLRSPRSYLPRALRRTGVKFMGRNIGGGRE
jgi:hypothetical protein